MDDRQAVLAEKLGKSLEEGAEAILQVRAASLSDDDRLAKHLATRP